MQRNTSLFHTTYYIHLGNNLYIVYACRTSIVLSIKWPLNISSVAVHSHLTAPFGSESSREPSSSLTVHKTPIKRPNFHSHLCLSVFHSGWSNCHYKQTTCWSPPLYFQDFTLFSVHFLMPLSQVSLFSAAKIGLHPCLSLLLLQVDEWPWSQAMAFLQAAPSRALPGKMAIEIWGGWDLSLKGNIPIGSMGRTVYLPTWMLYFYGKCR